MSIRKGERLSFVGVVDILVLKRFLTAIAPVSLKAAAAFAEFFDVCGTAAKRALWSFPYYHYQLSV
nr:hypothetical protein [Leminorella richardii]